MKPNSRGARWERLAESYLRRQGLKTLRRNFHCRMGELDLIMKQEDAIVFVEVRYRRRSRHGSGLETVTGNKRLRISRTAGIFLNQNPELAGNPCRFDVVSITGSGRGPDLRWIRNAFDAQVT